MPGYSGVTVVTTLVCSLPCCTRGCGRIERPAFPAPSDWRVRKFLANLGRIRPRDRGCLRGNVIASGAKQSILPLLGEMDCFAPLAMTRCSGLLTSARNDALFRIAR